MAEMRASPVVNPKFKRIADVLRDLQGPMGQIIPFTDVNPFKVLMPQASTFENLAYGNSPFSEYAGVTNRRLPIVKTGREGELTDIADVALMASGLPMASRGVARGANYLGDVMTQAVTRNPQATSMRALDEIARMSPVPQIAPKPPQVPMTPPKSDIGFYSQLEAATIPLQNKGTGDQYLAQIQKSAGVKPEEIQWTGLSEFLAGKPSVTKAEIQDYLNANRVDVQEVRLGDGPNPYPYRSADEWQGAIDRAEAAGDWDEADRLNNAWEASEGYGVEGTTKFSKYTLPGGENYREILLTLPAKQLTEAEARVVLGAAPDAKLSSADIAYASRKNVDEYRSSHFDQPNILAHLRVNDRTVDGKKTLFIEEIQSDWHQAGRKQGYAGEQESFEQWYNRNKLDGDPPFNKLTSQQIQIAKRNMELGMGSGVPDAPFKTSWHELSLKRAIQEAAEKGYDQIAFTTGKTQAERYDLSKQVDELFYWQNRLIAAKNQRSVFDKSNVSPEQLENFVGKDVAKKLLESKPDNVGARKLFGEDLQVGGEGMKGFYDNILPKSLDKLGKKFGAKVGKTEMDGVEVWQMDITPQMRESVTTKGQPLFAIPTIGAAALGASMYDQDPLEQFLNSQ